MTENEIAKIVVDAEYHIHRGLGPCFLESVYEVILAYALSSKRLKGRRWYQLYLMAFSGLPIAVGFLCGFAGVPAAALREIFSFPVYPG